ncbi:Permease of the drug/metabolite transporter (DMT) superfamily [Halanaeroarchaeum sp. HSR-CO]|uniref:DMT family transporter n=1 Tax=Halanaeroarchaeum sp. HSR-CO TaxID=2866382 RepID=UPI00217E352C|nr:DMT family transporter [Halanaeroarchaeum sp. HSR-CO]UWG46913.1 Permease of the drug/metabolite transporter (DMT) superfamily [Halanaeroarchaeum sp. HSR-CO]
MTAATIYALALLPAVIWGFTPILSKRGMAGGGSSLQASLVVVAVDTTLYLLVLLATRGTEIFVDLPLAAIALFVLAGVVGTALGRLAIFTGVDRVGAAINTAAVSIRPLFATILAVFLLGESVGLHTAIGILVVVTGLVALTLSKGGDITGWERADLLYPLLAALLFAIGNVARRYGLVSFPDVSLLEAVALNEFGGMVALGTFAVVAGRRDVLYAPRKTYAYFAGSGTLTAVALLSLFAALQAERVAIVDPLSATAPLFTTLFAAVLLRDLEQVTRQVVLGAALIVFGVVVITAF